MRPEEIRAPLSGEGLAILETRGVFYNLLRDQWQLELNAAVEAEYRHRRTGYLAALQGWLRDVWLFNSGVSADLAVFPNLVEEAEVVAGRLSPTEAADNLAIIEQTQRTLHTTVQELLVLEVGMLKLKL